jgi:hypothetical protein
MDFTGVVELGILAEIYIVEHLRNQGLGPVAESADQWCLQVNHSNCQAGV